MAFSSNTCPNCNILYLFLRLKPKPKQLNTNLTIYYGSQTGTAFGFAKDLAQESIKYGVKAKVVDLDVFNVAKLLKERLVVFVIATYGNGGPTINSAKLYKWLNSVDDCKLNDLQFAVFGCGDRMYKHFNKMAKIVTEGLEKRGGVKLCETGTGDASDDIQADFSRWKQLFWKTLTTTHKLNTTLQPKYQPTIATFNKQEIEAATFANTEFDLTTQQYIQASNCISKQ